MNNYSRKILTNAVKWVIIIENIEWINCARKGVTALSAYYDSQADIVTRQFILNENTPLIISDAYKKIRTNILSEMTEKGFPCIAVTSQCKGDGKTTTAANLSIALSMLGKRVLLIDADLRRPSLHNLFRLKNRCGLSTALTGASDIYDAISQEVLRDFHVMPSGPVPDNPADILGGANMERLIRMLYKYYDCVIIDTPPLCVANDALLFNRFTAGIVLVIRENKTTHTDVKNALLTISLGKTHLIGAVKTHCQGIKDEAADYRTVLNSEEQDDEDDEE